MTTNEEKAKRKIEILADDYTLFPIFIIFMYQKNERKKNLKE